MSVATSVGSLASLPCAPAWRPIDRDGAEVTDELSLEVEELTGVLRSDPDFEIFRDALRQHGLDPSQVLLGGLIDDEDGDSYCAFVTQDGCIAAEFMRGSVTRWEVVQDPSRLISAFSAIEVAVDRAHRGR